MEQIDKGQGAYIIAVKDNQPTLLEEIKSMVVAKLGGFKKTWAQVPSIAEKVHGRIDERRFVIINLLRTLL